MARPINMEALPPHPAVGEDRFITEMYGHTAYCADVTCPACGSKRTYTCGVLRQQLKRSNFTGHCKKCSVQKSQEGTRRWRKNEDKPSRWPSKDGYILIGPTFVSDDELPMFRAMQAPSKASMGEHRWNMAKRLGRPLKPYECVDHRDGDKTNNDAGTDDRDGNLRVYIRGKQQEGSCPGYGTYYHEWQVAESKIRRLQAVCREHGIEPC